MAYNIISSSPFFHKTYDNMVLRRIRDHKKHVFCLDNNILFFVIKYSDDILTEFNKICKIAKLRETPQSLRLPLFIRNIE
jgi:hypothetical protein